MRDDIFGLTLAFIGQFVAFVIASIRCCCSSRCSQKFITLLASVFFMTNADATKHAGHMLLGHILCCSSLGLFVDPHRVGTSYLHLTFNACNGNLVI